MTTAKVETFVGLKFVLLIDIHDDNDRFHLSDGSIKSVLIQVQIQILFQGWFQTEIEFFLLPWLILMLVLVVVLVVADVIVLIDC